MRYIRLIVLASALLVVAVPAVQAQARPLRSVEGGQSLRSDQHSAAQQHLRANLRSPLPLVFEPKRHCTGRACVKHPRLSSPLR